MDLCWQRGVTSEIRWKRHSSWHFSLHLSLIPHSGRKEALLRTALWRGSRCGAAVLCQRHLRALQSTSCSLCHRGRDHSPAWQLDRNPMRKPEPEPTAKLLSDSWPRSSEIVRACFFRLLICGVICYPVLDNLYTASVQWCGMISSLRKISTFRQKQMSGFL